MKKYKIALSLFLIGFIAQAQEVNLSLKEALNYALEHKSEALKARLEVENSNYQIQEVRAMALPQINIEGSLTNNPIIQKSALPGEIIGAPGTTLMVPFGLEWGSSLTASVSQILFNQSVFTGLKAAKTTREFYKINSTLTDEQLIEKVAQSYYQVYQSQQMLKTIESNVSSTTKVKDIIENLYSNGLATKIDLDRTKVSLSNLQAKRQQIINSIELQENSLKFLIGMDLHSAIKMPNSTFDINEAVVFSESNIENRTEMQLLKKQEELYTYQKKAKLSEHYPTLALFGNFGYQGLGDNFPWFKETKDQVYWTNSAMVGLTLKIPVFQGLGTRAKVKQAEIDLQKIELDIKDTKQALSLDFKNAQTQIQNALITIRIQEENVALAKDVMYNIQNNYRNGIAPLTDLLSAETAFTEAENNYTTALLDYKLAEVALIKAQGELTTLLK
ncbi:TolC family protein [Myroides guanonis]|uniref:Outer membrane protein TolC n=1 Tax=Myroides guanonis TaxID=1150112 RepID=A0A1I3Q831_9FLAO|nr:TolC family protein [Myroides guanonis]SFJ29521.1 Outer membrane protein TolC [Myroides guanonis]